MSLFIVDISSAQQGLDVASLPRQGFSALIVKCTEGNGYINPFFASWVRDAQRIGFPVASYHYLHAGNWDAQAANIHQVDPPPVPVWLDAEAGATRDDAYQVAIRLRRLGQTVAGIYFGSSPTPGYGGWWRAFYGNDPSGYASSVYASMGGDHGGGWNPGGGTPDLWQFCQHGKLSGFAGEVDFSAFRGTTAQLLSRGWFWSSSVVTPPTPAPTPTPVLQQHRRNKMDFVITTPANGAFLYRLNPDAVPGSGKPLYNRWPLPSLNAGELAEMAASGFPVYHWGAATTDAVARLTA